MERNEGDCSNCPSRWFCKVLCDPAKWYVGQDHIGGDLPVEFLTPRPLPHIDNPTYLTKTESEIFTLLGRGLTRKEVCKNLKMQGFTLRKHISNVRKKYLNVHDFN